MCTFDGARYIEAQLASIAAQTVRPAELVVSDDGSTDGTVALVERFAATVDFPVKVSVNPHRLGVTANFERASELCSGEVIVLADQDDVWLPHRLATLARLFENDDHLLLAFSNAWLINEQGRRTGDLHWSIVGFSAAQQARMTRDPFGQLMGRSIVSGCSLAFRSSCRS